MKKISLFDAVHKKMLDATFLTVDDASEYTSKCEEYKREYRKISFFNELLRGVLWIISVLTIAGSISSFIIYPLNTFNVLIAIAALLVSIGCFVYYKVLREEHRVEESIKYFELKNIIIDEIIELNFKELYEFARNDKNILKDAFTSALEIEVDEARIEPYIKGFIRNKLFYIDHDKEQKNKKIEEVISDYKS